MILSDDIVKRAEQLRKIQNRYFPDKMEDHIFNAKLTAYTMEAIDLTLNTLMENTEIKKRENENKDTEF